MKVGINLLFLKPGLAGGTETYSINLLRAMAQLSDENIAYCIFCSSELNLSFLEHSPRFSIIRYKRVSRSLAYRFFFEQVIFPYRLKKHKLDILHSHGYVGPLFAKNHIVTIHDTNAFERKVVMPLPKRLLLSFFLLAISKTCRHIIAVSRFSKNEIIQHLSAAPNKISVIYEACKYSNGINKPASLAGVYGTLPKGGYFMGLSSLSPHKNMQTLIAAFKLVSLEYPGIKLVLAGHLPPGITKTQLFEDTALIDRIVITGFVDDATLAALFENALCFIFPSLYEGFGLPLLEAQNAGIPVIASNRGSLPEIGGGSAIYFPAEDAHALCEKMQNLLLNEPERVKYSALGKQNIKRFSWEATAKETLKLYCQFNK